MYPTDAKNGRSERIRTSDPLVPNEVRYQAALHSDLAVRNNRRWSRALYSRTLGRLQQVFDLFRHSFNRARVPA